MPKNSFLQLVIFFLFLSTLPGYGQTLTKKEMEEKAYNALNEEDYVTAYTKFDELNSKYPKDYDYKLKLGICCLKNPERKERSVEIFTELKNTYKTVELDYYLGKAYHANYKFVEAVELLEKFIGARRNSIISEEKELVEDAKLIVTNCKNGKLLIDNKVIADIKPIGDPINSEEDQYVPVIATDESILFFTYRGKFSVGGKLNSNLEPDPIEGRYNEDVYIAYKRPDGLFSEPQGLDALNTKGSDAAIAISPDGQTLFTFYSDSKNSGDIQMSKLIGDEFSKPVSLNKNINTDYWEGSCSISGDGKFLYFASERPGGIGGRDIWVSEKIDGDWGVAKNMGPKINTPYDDDAPFIHPDGITLFLSSKGHSSIGGYDIMFSIKQGNDWATPQSMGLPLNSTEDDRFYVINSRGDRGYFSSDRAFSGGKGKNDIYTVTPGILGEKPVIALLKGAVYGNDQPLEAKLEITKVMKGENASSNEFGTYFSNSSTGKYLTTLTPGAIYKIKVSADNYESVEEDLDLENLKEYMEITKDFYLVSTKAVTNVADTTKTISITPTTAISNNLPCSDKTLPDFSSLKGKSLNDINYYKQLLDMAGDYCAENLVFKVQIGAYRKPQNFKYPNLESFGKADAVNYPDGITRFTQKEFTTIKEAEVQRQKAIARGQTDAWIVAFIDGKRYTLENLILLDFLGKTIN